MSVVSAATTSRPGGAADPDQHYLDLLKHARKALENYSPNTETPATSIERYFKENKLREQSDALFVSQVFFGVLQNIEFLKTFSKSLIFRFPTGTQHRDETLYQIMFYLLHYRFDELGPKEFKKFVNVCPAPAMHNIFAFIQDRHDLCDWVLRDWAKVYDWSHLHESVFPSLEKKMQILAPLIREVGLKATGPSEGTSPQQQQQGSSSASASPPESPKSPSKSGITLSLHDSSNNSADTGKPAKRPLTKPQPFKLTKPKPRVFPEPEEVSRLVVAGKPPSRNTGGIDLASIQKQRQESLQAAREVTRKKFKSAATKPLPMPEPPCGRLSEVRWNASAVLRADAVLQETLKKEAAVLHQFESELRDAAEFYEWKSKKLQEDEDKRKKAVQMRKAEMELCREAAIQAQIDAVEAKGVAAENFRLVRERDLKERERKLEEEDERLRYNAADAKAKRGKYPGIAAKIVSKKRRKVLRDLRERHHNLEWKAKLDDVELLELKERIRQQKALDKESAAVNRPPPFDPSQPSYEAPTVMNQVSLVELRAMKGLQRELFLEEEEAKRVDIFRKKAERADALMEKARRIARLRHAAGQEATESREQELEKIFDELQAKRTHGQKLVLECSEKTDQLKGLEREDEARQTSAKIAAAKAMAIKKKEKAIREKEMARRIGEARNTQGRRRRTIEYVALKSISIGRRRQVLNEVAILKHLSSHPNVLKFHEYHESANHIWMVLEYCSGGDMQGLLQEDGKLPMDSIRRFAFEIASGLQHIHSMGVIHGDLRPKNLCFDDAGVIKIFDFGQLGGDRSTLGSISSAASPAYLPPEVLLDGAPLSVPGDLWSFGCLLYELRAGRRLFALEGNSVEAMKSAVDRPDLSPVLGECLDFVSLLKGLLQVDPLKRLDWEGLASHPFWLGGGGTEGGTLSHNRQQQQQQQGVHAKSELQYTLPRLQIPQQTPLLLFMSRTRKGKMALGDEAAVCPHGKRDDNLRNLEGDCDENTPPAVSQKTELHQIRQELPTPDATLALNSRAQSRTQTAVVPSPQFIALPSSGRPSGTNSFVPRDKADKGEANERAAQRDALQENEAPRMHRHQHQQSRTVSGGETRGGAGSQRHSFQLEARGGGLQGVRTGRLRERALRGFGEGGRGEGGAARERGPAGQLYHQNVQFVVRGESGRAGVGGENEGRCFPPSPSTSPSPSSLKGNGKQSDGARTTKRRGAVRESLSLYLEPQKFPNLVGDFGRILEELVTEALSSDGNAPSALASAEQWAISQTERLPSPPSSARIAELSERIGVRLVPLAPPEGAGGSASRALIEEGRREKENLMHRALRGLAAFCSEAAGGSDPVRSHDSAQFAVDLCGYLRHLLSLDRASPLALRGIKRGKRRVGDGKGQMEGTSQWQSGDLADLALFSPGFQQLSAAVRVLSKSRGHSQVVDAIERTLLLTASRAACRHRREERNEGNGAASGRVEEVKGGGSGSQGVLSGREWRALLCLVRHTCERMEEWARKSEGVASSLSQAEVSVLGFLLVRLGGSCGEDEGSGEGAGGCGRDAEGIREVAQRGVRALVSLAQRDGLHSELGRRALEGLEILLRRGADRAIGCGWVDIRSLTVTAGVLLQHSFACSEESLRRDREEGFSGEGERGNSGSAVGGLCLSIAKRLVCRDPSTVWAVVSSLSACLPLPLDSDDSSGRGHGMGGKGVTSACRLVFRQMVEREQNKGAHGSDAKETAVGEADLSQVALGNPISLLVCAFGGDFLGMAGGAARIPSPRCSTAIRGRMSLSHAQVEAADSALSILLALIASYPDSGTLRPLVSRSLLDSLVSLCFASSTPSSSSPSPALSPSPPTPSTSGGREGGGDVTGGRGGAESRGRAAAAAAWAERRERFGEICSVHTKALLACALLFGVDLLWLLWAVEARGRSVGGWASPTPLSSLPLRGEGGEVDSGPSPAALGGGRSRREREKERHRGWVAAVQLLDSESSSQAGREKDVSLKLQRHAGKEEPAETAGPEAKVRLSAAVRLCTELVTEVVPHLLVSLHKMLSSLPTASEEPEQQQPGGIQTRDHRVSEVADLCRVYLQLPRQLLSAPLFSHRLLGPSPVGAVGPLVSLLRIACVERESVGGAKQGKGRERRGETVGGREETEEPDGAPPFAAALLGSIELVVIACSGERGSAEVLRLCPHLISDCPPKSGLTSVQGAAEYRRTLSAASLRSEEAGVEGEWERDASSEQPDHGGVWGGLLFALRKCEWVGQMSGDQAVRSVVQLASLLLPSDESSEGGSSAAASASVDSFVSFVFIPSLLKLVSPAEESGEGGWEKRKVKGERRREELKDKNAEKRQWKGGKEKEGEPSACVDASWGSEEEAVSVERDSARGEIQQLALSLIGACAEWRGDAVSLALRHRSGAVGTIIGCIERVFDTFWTSQAGVSLLSFVLSSGLLPSPLVFSNSSLPSLMADNLEKRVQAQAAQRRQQRDRRNRENESDAAQSAPPQSEGIVEEGADGELTSAILQLLAAWGVSFVKYHERRLPHDKSPPSRSASRFPFAARLLTSALQLMSLKGEESQIRGRGGERGVCAEGEGAERGQGPAECETNHLSMQREALGAATALVRGMSLASSWSPIHPSLSPSRTVGSFPSPFSSPSPPSPLHQSLTEKEKEAVMGRVLEKAGDSLLQWDEAVCGTGGGGRGASTRKIGDALQDTRKEFEILIAEIRRLAPVATSRLLSSARFPGSRLQKRGGTVREDP
uniref:Protein kinase domain-containing protein n=1 Tax=Chromera velia CCMP2878 TaxID=1169474 RepID=A0A0G4HN82_9ALVE|eukprot:Cvel_7651.t1-p1 / transcript=Cvel_7651.t1 / gene=Cvel_7651 / organism=Chromera_velia_CCMP2878 / gene_product=Serine/threonine-protein kinase ULK4, putative / transcript_product=Serine/threonine-protein kinase ULK4, putative / location=Cvel_scaffold405:28115-51137(+) / protein_length=2728 / sequence_SO=supercontig / SO=protein_coding / is_pseudo=false